MPHIWLKLTQQVVDVIVDPEGNPYSVSRPGEPIGEAIGCDTCGVPLTPEFLTLPCEPAVISL